MFSVSAGRKEGVQPYGCHSRRWYATDLLSERIQQSEVHHESRPGRVHSPLSATFFPVSNTPRRTTELKPETLAGCTSV